MLEFKERQLAPLLKHRSSILGVQALLEDITDTGSILTLVCAHRGCRSALSFSLSHQALVFICLVHSSASSSCPTTQTVLKRLQTWTHCCPHCCTVWAHQWTSISQMNDNYTDSLTFSPLRLPLCSLPSRYHFHLCASPIYINFLNFLLFFLLHAVV